MTNEAGILALVRALRLRAVVAALVALAIAAPAAGAQRFEQGLLWRVDGTGAPASHVFGTIHVDDPRVTKLPTAVARELNDARSLTLEAVFDPSQMLALGNRLLFLDGRDLPGTVGPELYGKTAALMGKLGLPDPMVRMFKPWAVALLLSVPQQNPAEVLDILLARIAAERNKPVHALESLAEQIATFEQMAEADQIALLRRAVDQHEHLPRLIGRLIEAYLARDLAAMWRISEESAGASPEARGLNEILVRRLLDGRNSRMAERMQERLREGKAFVAIGALHLYGERGVLALLERSGWRLTRVY